MAPRILYVVTEDWYFLSHRLPMARAAKKAGYEVHVAARYLDGAAAVEAEGFVPHRLDWSRGSISARDSLAAILQLRRLMREVKPRLVHNVALKPVLLGTLAGYGLQDMAIVNTLTGMGALFVDGGGASGLTRKLVVMALSRLLRRVRSVTVVQNPEDRAFVAGLGVPEAAIMIIAGSGVDIEKYQPLPEPEGTVTAAFVGRMLQIKGVQTLVEAFRRATDGRADGKEPELHLVLAGDCDPENPGSLAPEQLREFASAYGITWLGRVEDVREVWKKAHFAVQPSRGGEGLPKSLLEAAASGRPMVATDVPGCREIAVPGKTGLLVPVDDVGALAIAMLELARDSSLRQHYGAEARRLTEEKFSSRVIGQEAVALYERLIAS
ncbi:MAG: glycosyltransferase family 4 protein [Methyloceanibacter sp.]|jgi:glycosyltransferase involved in cell wall biosynthesis|uniref:glycosyltransferase family 4 protein n=1 Tax=Methyloceanibacter sp. TaxID=1965321 RepID=UPI003C5D5A20